MAAHIAPDVAERGLSTEDTDQQGDAQWAGVLAVRSAAGLEDVVAGIIAQAIAIAAPEPIAPDPSRSHRQSVTPGSASTARRNPSYCTPGSANQPFGS